MKARVPLGALALLAAWGSGCASAPLTAYPPSPYWSPPSPTRLQSPTEALQETCVDSTGNSYVWVGEELASTVRRTLAYDPAGALVFIRHRSCAPEPRFLYTFTALWCKTREYGELPGCVVNDARRWREWESFKRRFESQR